MNSNESFSESQLLEQLNEQMQTDGVLSRVKLQMRQEIISKLQGQATQTKKTRTFDEKVGDCFVGEYLRGHKLFCSYQVFLEECHLEQPLEKQELLQLCGLQLNDFAEFMGSESAMDVLRKVVKRRYHIERSDHSCQTEERELTYEQKLKSIENQYLKKVDYSRLNDMQSIEDRMNKYRIDVEKRYQTQMVSELARIRDWEIKQVQMEERMRYEQMLKKLQAGEDNDYAERVKELKKKEDEALRSLNIKMKEFEKECYRKKQEIQELMDELEQEKIKYHRHKCIESEVVQRELAELNGMKDKLALEMKEYEQSRMALERQAQKQSEMVNQYWKDKNEQLEKPAVATKGDDWIEYQKDSCLRLQKQREYLSQENEVLRKETMDLQFKEKSILGELDRCREELMRAKDEREVEHNYSLRLEGQLRLLREQRE